MIRFSSKWINWNIVCYGIPHTIIDDPPALISMWLLSVQWHQVRSYGRYRFDQVKRTPSERQLFESRRLWLDMNILWVSRNKKDPVCMGLSGFNDLSIILCRFQKVIIITSTASDKLKIIKLVIKHRCRQEWLIGCTGDRCHEDRYRLGSRAEMQWPVFS